MTDLLTELREHDLPPRWDGRAVVWEGWTYPPTGVFICPPPPPEACTACGRPTTDRGFPCWSINKGMRADSTRLTHDDYASEEAARDRLPFLAKGRMPRHWWLELHAIRCHHCQLDTVWDQTTDEWWTLDHTDYGPDGSNPPAPTTAPPAAAEPPTSGRAAFHAARDDLRNSRDQLF